jgi:hypothetical protein
VAGHGTIREDEACMHVYSTWLLKTEKRQYGSERDFHRRFKFAAFIMYVLILNLHPQIVATPINFASSITALRP